MRSLLALLFLVLATPSFAQNDEEGVREAFEAYRTALLAQDGEAALRTVDGRTVAFYGRSVRQALRADSVTVAALPLVERLTVLSLRHRVPLATLESFTGRTAFVYAVDQGWIGRGDVENARIHRVEIGDKEAVAYLERGGGRRAGTFVFRRSGNGWHLDLTSAFEEGTEELLALVQSLDMTSDEFIAYALTLVSDEPVTDALWHPPASP